jgi:hypothetical protein
VEKFQKIYQYTIKIDDTIVDKLLMMWKTAGEIIFYVEICGKGIVFTLFLQEFSTVCWYNVEKIVLLFFHLIDSQCGKKPCRRPNF